MGEKEQGEERVAGPSLKGSVGQEMTDSHMCFSSKARLRGFRQNHYLSLWGFWGLGCGGEGIS